MTKVATMRVGPTDTRADLLAEVLEASLAGFAILRGRNFVYELVNSPIKP